MNTYHIQKILNLIIQSTGLLFTVAALSITTSLSATQAGDELIPSASPPAQNQFHRPPSVDEALSMMQVELDLSAEQLTQIQPILEEHHVLRRLLLNEIHTTSSPDERRALREQMRVLHAQTFEDINVYLNDQQSVLAHIRASEMKEKVKQRITLKAMGISRENLQAQ